ncbi:MAG: hypothetical protein A2787_00575 [Omnitrophica WOR_2 bacterium RIFCSPHIGHO2_01_FULL_48_9]|nr:MAG: hypothetical protein A3D10_00010 [Omnitrophica WOR_2 bacterium RIFCSPHIGHO2_02_FULL_48_11]OGX33627.1 MAG: hypothetical protein A2787_00575 [Omnitrophica WOR_2 bacterium RIFCSPHIGHO2_01_FULL_48_9]
MTNPLPDPVSRRPNFWQVLYEKLVKINDTPQKIALGFGLGVFAGILPGTGPVASLVLAVIFRVNRVAALTGSLLTNTWLSFVTFLFAVKVGSWVTGAQWSEVQESVKTLWQDFRWENLFDVSVMRIFYPLIVGYVLIGLTLGLVTYFLALTVVTARRKRINPGNR